MLDLDQRFKETKDLGGDGTMIDKITILLMVQFYIFLDKILTKPCE